jgi:DNA repair protein RAD57
MVLYSCLELAEIVFGESGCGKTQLALYLTACTLATGCCGAVYVSTESLFPIDRFVQLLDRYFPPYGPQSRQQMLDNLHLEHAYDLDVQWHVLRYQLPRLLQLCAERRNGAGQHPIRLLVIDSIAANYRYGLEDGDDDEGDGDDQENDGKLLLLGNKISTAARRKKAAYRRNHQLHQLGTQRQDTREYETALR